MKKKKKDNILDEIKKTKFSSITKKDILKQKKYFLKFVDEILYRKSLGNEKYGNYMMKIDRDTAIRELEEELMDVCSHLIMLGYRTRCQEKIK